MNRPVQLFDTDLAAVDGLWMRRMVAGDLTSLMEVEKRAFKTPWSEDLIRRELTHEWSTILLALDPDSDGNIVGFVIFWVVHDEVHILNVAVDPPHRRRGIARSLLGEVLRRAKEAGLALVTLEVRISNEGAIRLYEGLGFRRVGVRKGYYVDEDEDAIVMVLDL